MTKKSNQYYGISNSLHSSDLYIKEPDTAAGNSEPTPLVMCLSVIPPVTWAV